MIVLQGPAKGDGDGSSVEGGGVEGTVGDGGGEDVAVRGCCVDVGFWYGRKGERGWDEGWIGVARRVDEGEGRHRDWNPGLSGNQEQLNVFGVCRLVSRGTRSVVECRWKGLLQLDRLRCCWGSDSFADSIVPIRWDYQNVEN